MAVVVVCLAQSLAGCASDNDAHSHAVFERDLLDSLESGSTPARVDAARNFLEIEPSRQAVDMLRRGLVDPSAIVRVAAARALAKWPAHRGELDELLTVLAVALDAGDPDVRAEAAQALGSLGPAARGLVPRLEHAARDSNTHVRDEARSALRAIRRAPGS